ncbi:MAG: alanine racemase [Bacillota bacterium]
MKITRPTWAEINLDNLKNNIKEVKRVSDKDALITAVVKADGYGHGALGIIKTLLKNGADRLAVATINEALQIRKKFKDVDILILGYTANDFYKELIDNNITQTVYDYNQAKFFNKKAKELGKELTIHIKVDTGMHRLGFHWKNNKDIEKIYKLDNLNVEGIFTHFAKADEKDKSFTVKQFNRFNSIISELDDNNINIPIKHISNSAAIIDLPEFSYNMVRAGIMLYGLYPSDEVSKDNVNLKPVMEFKTKISSIKRIKKGQGVSYGLIYKADHDQRIGALAVGYADGFTRLLTSKGEVLVGSKRKKILGRICMDQCMIDLSNKKAKIGDEVSLFGGSRKNAISVDEVAEKIGTINYEIVCMVSKRVPRVYLKNGEIVNIVDYLL